MGQLSKVSFIFFTQPHYALKWPLLTYGRHKYKYNGFSVLLYHRKSIAHVDDLFMPEEMKCAGDHGFVHGSEAPPTFCTRDVNFRQYNLERGNKKCHLRVGLYAGGDIVLEHGSSDREYYTY